jgi:hypothetical protein
MMWKLSSMSDGDTIIKWLVEVLHYPFDVSYENPPPIDHDELARYWNEWDDWGVTDDEAIATVREESGLGRVHET